MSVQELIDELKTVKDKSLDVMVGSESDCNLWVDDISVHRTGDSGYEEFGAVVLEVTE